MLDNQTILKSDMNTLEDLKRKNQKLQREITLKNQIFDTSPNYIILVGLDGKIIEVNQLVKDHLPPEVVPKKLSQLNIIHIKDLYKFINAINSICKGETIEPFKSIFIKPDKEFIDVNVTISPVMVDNEIIAISIHASKITANNQVEDSQEEFSSLHQALDDKDMLVKEIHHRTKNNLMIMASLLSLTSNDIDDENAREIFDQTKTRIRSMAIIHEKLYKSDDLKQINFGDYIRNLANDLFESFLTKSNHIQLIMELEDIKMDIEIAIPLGILLNELLTNSIKYAFPEKKCGNIFIKFAKANNHYVLVVADDGIGLPKDLDVEKCDTLGFQLVKNLVGQIEGEMMINRDEGTEITVCFHDKL